MDKEAEKEREIPLDSSSLMMFTLQPEVFSALTFLTLSTCYISFIFLTLLKYEIHTKCIVMINAHMQRES